MLSIQVVLFSSLEHIAKRGQKHVKHTEAQKPTNSRKPFLARVNTTREGSSLHAAENVRARVSLCAWPKKLVCP